MSEARELLERVAAVARKHSVEMGEGVASMHSVLAADIGITLATQPEPGAVPELPEFVQIDAAGDYAIKVGGGHVLTCSSTSISPDDLDVIGDTFHILAARERARRAGS